MANLHNPINASDTECISKQSILFIAASFKWLIDFCLFFNWLWSHCTAILLHSDSWTKLFTLSWCSNVILYLIRDRNSFSLAPHLQRVVLVIIFKSRLLLFKCRSDNPNNLKIYMIYFLHLRVIIAENPFVLTPFHCNGFATSVGSGTTRNPLLFSLCDQPRDSILANAI